MLNNIVLIGMPGCGKTTIGLKLSKDVGFDFIDMDDYIVEKNKMTIEEIFKKGESLFRQYETEACSELSKKNNTIIATGGGVVKTPGNMDYFSDDTVIFLNRPVEEIIKTVDINTRPLLKDGATKVYNLYNERIDLYRKYSDFEISNYIKVSDVINQIKEIIKNENYVD